MWVCVLTTMMMMMVDGSLAWLAGYLVGYFSFLLLLLAVAVDGVVVVVVRGLLIVLL